MITVSHNLQITDFTASLATVDIGLSVIFLVLLFLLFQVLPLAVVFFVTYLLFSLPLRRKERARLFLDLVDVTLRQGRPLEPTLTSLSRTGDPAMGVRFHQLAAHLERGVSFGAALEQVPRLLPPRVRAMLQAGLQIGDLRRVLPACRQVLGDATEHTRSAINYLVVLAFVITPISALIPWFLLRMVVPKFIEIFDGLVPGTPAPPLLSTLVSAQPWITTAVFLLIVMLWFGALCYMGGPRLTQSLQTAGPRFFDWLQLIVPWQRKRLHRDFSSVLAVLLDSGMPEALSLVGAAKSTTNEVFLRRAHNAAAQLEQGSRLTEVIANLDGSGEFRWRLTNAVHGHGGFLASLTGWHDALDAQATQQEQTAAQLFTTGLVLLNGALIALVILTIFSALVAVINGGVLW